MAIQSVQVSRSAAAYDMLRIINSKDSAPIMYGVWRSVVYSYYDTGREKQRSGSQGIRNER